MILFHLILDLTQRRSSTNLWEPKMTRRDDIRDFDLDDGEGDDDVILETSLCQLDALSSDCPFSLLVL